LRPRLFGAIDVVKVFDHLDFPRLQREFGVMLEG
jgi:hypothetical protein